jgi:Zn-dependent protease with chaperone function
MIPKNSHGQRLDRSRILTIVSPLLTLSFLLLQACSAKTVDPESASREAHRLRLAVEQQYPEYSLSRSQAQLVPPFLLELTQRLAAALAGAGRPLPYTVEIYLCDSAQPLALSPGPGLIVVSSSLLRTLPSEAALAFVLAHELAHHAYGHLLQIQNQELTSPEQLQEWEGSADRLALGIVAIAGYDPWHALLALNSGYRALAPEALANTVSSPGQGASHPSLNQRSSAVREQIIASGWRGPAIETRRIFRKVQASLRG